MLLGSSLQGAVQARVCLLFLRWSGLLPVLALQLQRVTGVFQIGYYLGHFAGQDRAYGSVMLYRADGAPAWIEEMIHSGPMLGYAGGDEGTVLGQINSEGTS